jgi:folylpolyglutamate synthase/dihydropteroate synthase
MCENHQSYEEAWKNLRGNFTVHTIADLDAAMRLATQLGSRTDDFGTSVLITGSFHLVGQALRALELSTA